MVEEVEEILERCVFLLEPLEEGLGVMAGEHAGRAGQTEEADDHLRRPARARAGTAASATNIARPVEPADLAGGEPERIERSEADEFLGWAIVAHGAPARLVLIVGVRGRSLPSALPLDLFQQANGLEEAKPLGRACERFAETQTRIFSPIRAGHRRSSSLRPLTRATVRTNELDVQ